MSSPSKPRSIPDKTHLESPRVLACVFCQQRKVKCDRRFPCSNCIKHRTRCLPAMQRRRKRRFPERELLDRLRKYEDLLRLNNIKFDSLHKTKSDESPLARDGSEDEQPESGWSSCEKLEDAYEAKNIYHAMKHGFPQHSSRSFNSPPGTSSHFNTDPRSISSLLSIAIRIVQRIGIHSEAANSQCTIFEAEMRRRLWWSLMLFDSRISDLSDYKATMLAPTWDCKVPINTNDYELRVETKVPLFPGKPPSRSSQFPEAYLQTPGGVDDIAALEKMVEEKYLQFSQLSKLRLLEHFSKRPHSPSVRQPPTQAQGDATLSYALRMLESNTKVMSSPLTKGYVWFCHLHIPLPAYIHILRDLMQRRSWSEPSRQAWEIMSENYEAWFGASNTNAPPNSLVSDTLFGQFTKIILQTWEVLEKPGQKDMLAPPRIISSIRQKRADVAADIQNDHDTASSDSAIGASIGDLFLSMPCPIAFGSPSLGFGMGEQDGYSGMDPKVYPHMSLGDTNQSNWASMHWGLG
ncbi:hypothetical protein N7474_009121 [Penicillium riverlandense]|uniref:uncharacterized protein n=1 Tax=Penicillium riverlandense TaxID=1903569 RepID=UPI0025493FD9|nr:uncharacterized protein N7474_009121 [Penicillium riverlandense]KAJ5807852.1 hypothetical protein N7474_009121 [Penicillium riverlandense]